MQENVCCF